MGNTTSCSTSQLPTFSASSLFGFPLSIIFPTRLSQPPQSFTFLPLLHCSNPAPTTPMFLPYSSFPRSIYLYIFFPPCTPPSPSRPSLKPIHSHLYTTGNVIDEVIGKNHLEFSVSKNHLSVRSSRGLCFTRLGHYSWIYCCTCHECVARVCHQG